MVEVFKTNVRRKVDSLQLLEALSRTFPQCQINFDLSDRDKILRVAGDEPEIPAIIELLQEKGFSCQVLD